MSIQIEKEIRHNFLDILPYFIFSIPNLQAYHSYEPELESGYSNWKEYDPSGHDFGLGGEQVGLGKFFDFSGLKFAYFSHEGIFEQIHLLIAIDHEAISINTQQIFRSKIELHFVVVVSFEYGFGRQSGFLFFLFVSTYAHFVIRWGL